MTPKRTQRLLLITGLVAGVCIAATLAALAFRENMLFFFAPAQVQAGDAPVGRNFRLGGLVTDGSLQRGGDGLTVDFTVTDGAATVPVRYTGLLPDLFREGQGVVALGHLDADGRFVAEEVLAKHDEKYMPPEVAEALKTAQANQTNKAVQQKPTANGRPM
jgi:cytochrome c-type biogenesis protein CcmE